MTSLSESSSPSPTSVSGCVLWLDAADSDSMTVAAGKVSQWRDKSGLNNHATSPSSIREPTLTANALNNRSVMTFSGSQNFTGPLSLGTTFTQFIVYFNSSGRIGQGLMDSNDASLLGKLAYQEGGSECFQSGFGFSYQRFFKTGGAYRILMTKCSNPSSSATVSHWFNGTDQNISSGIWTIYGGNSTAITSITIGARGDLIYFIGTIAEIIIYNSVISLTQQREIEGYLAWKWGIQGSLPVGHPNYSVSGFSSPPFPLFALPTRAFKASMNSPYFTPTSITGCSLWFDAADTSSLVLSGSNVTQWSDKSGRGYNLTAVSGYANATVSSAYQNGLNVINFSGNGLYRTIANSAVYPQDVYIVIALKSTTAHVDVLGMGPTDVDYFNSLTFSEYSGSRWHNGSSGFNRTPNCVSPTNETSTSFLLIQWSLANANFLLRRNGSDLVQTNSYTYSLNNGSIFQIGYRHPNVTAANFNGYIGEILVYNTQLGSTDRQQVEGYLAWKWGLQASLPGAHSKYSVNGTIIGPFPPSVLPTTPFKIQFFAPITTTFSYTGADQSFIVPAGVTRITVYLWAAGGQGTTTINGSYYGGAGAYVQGILTVTPGETLTVYVGQRGNAGPTFAYKNGGYNSAADLGTGTAGGRSGIARSSTNIVAVGAGGGGGGNGNGGAGGISSGSAGTGTNPGGGGTQSAGGTAGSSSYNSGGVGQNFGGGTGPGAYGGSGGDGFYGGGGGAAFGSGQLGGGGGGGSSLTSNLTSLVTFVSSNGYSAPNTASPYYTSNIAAGGFGSSGTAGNGLVVIVTIV